MMRCFVARDGAASSRPASILVSTMALVLLFQAGISSAATGLRAIRLEAVETSVDSGAVLVRLRADGPIAPRIHWLPQTGRMLLVMDLPGIDVRNVKLASPFQAPILHMGLSQWRTQPLTGRLAVHLPAKRAWTIDTTGHDAVITILDEIPPEASQATNPRMKPAPRPGRPLRGETRTTAAKSIPPAAPAVIPVAAVASPAPPSDSHPSVDKRLVTLLFREAELTNVLRVIGEQNHLNLILPPDVHGTVTVFLEGIPVEEALRKILFVHGYGYVMQDDVLLIVPGVNDQGNYSIYRPGAPAAAICQTLEKLVPLPGKVFFDGATNSIILYAPQPGMKPVFESIYQGLLAAHTTPSGN